MNVVNTLIGPARAEVVVTAALGVLAEDLNLPGRMVLVLVVALSHAWTPLGCVVMQQQPGSPQQLALHPGMLALVGSGAAVCSPSWQAQGAASPWSPQVAGQPAPQELTNQCPGRCAIRWGCHGGLQWPALRNGKCAGQAEWSPGCWGQQC